MKSVWIGRIDALSAARMNVINRSLFYFLFFSLRILPTSNVVSLCQTRGGVHCDWGSYTRVTTPVYLNLGAR